MAYLYDDTINWSFIDIIDLWLDDKVSADYHNHPLAQDWARVGKVIEELGEAIGELILFTGQNPRKGIDPGAGERLMGELADTAITGILAIQHYTKDIETTRKILHEKVDAIYRRMANGVTE